MDPMKYFRENIGTQGRQILYYSHAGQASYSGNLRLHAGLIRSDSVSVDPLMPWEFNERYSPWPRPDMLISQDFHWINSGPSTTYSSFLFTNTWSAGQVRTLVFGDPSDDDWISFVETPVSREFRRGVDTELQFQMLFTGTDDFGVTMLLEYSNGIQLTDPDWYYGWGNPTPNELRTVTVPAGGFQVSQGQTLGLSALQTVRTTNGSFSGPFLLNDAQTILLSPHVRGQIPLSALGEIRCSSGEWVAGANGGVIQLRNVDSPALSATLSVGGDIHQVLLEDLEGDGGPELLVLSENSLSVHTTDSGFHQAFPPIALSGGGSARLMVIHGTMPGESARICLLDGDELRLFDASGQSLTSGAPVHLPSHLLPLRHAAWAGDDELGSRIALAGGAPLADQLILMNLDGSVLHEFDNALFGGASVEWGQLVCGDFLNNGVHDLVALAAVAQGNMSAPDHEELALITWSHEQQSWGGSRLMSLRTDPGVSGATQLVPIAGRDAAAPARLAWTGLPGAGVEDSPVVLNLLDLSRVLASDRLRSQAIPGQAGPRHLTVIRMDDDEAPDLIIHSPGQRVDLLFGNEDGFSARLGRSLIHHTESWRNPLPVRINGELCLGLPEEDNLMLYALYENTWPEWSDVAGPGAAGFLPFRTRFTLDVPTIGITFDGNRPTLHIDPVTFCNIAVIYRSANGGDFEPYEVVPWDGNTALDWTDDSLDPLPMNTRYRVRSGWLPNGPDGALYHQ
ncbi:MAG: hypothetical protein KDC10_12450 [Calditrichaeota bacterium]|nr:hypothetical protein [Calditrichota bacterium]